MSDEGEWMRQCKEREMTTCKWNFSCGCEACKDRPEAAYCNDCGKDMAPLIPTRVLLQGKGTPIFRNCLACRTRKIPKHRRKKNGNGSGKAA